MARSMGAIAMETADAIEFLRTLRTVRRFTDQPVPQAVLDDLLTVARWSGSASNRQPWAFIVVRDRETLRRLSELEGYVRHLAGAALAIVLVMDGDRGPGRAGDLRRRGAQPAAPTGRRGARAGVRDRLVPR